MTKHKTLLGLIAVSTIAISLGLNNGNPKVYDYQLTIDNILPIVERNRSAFQIRDYKEELIVEVIDEENSIESEDEGLEIVAEDMETVEETHDKIVEITNEKIVSNNYNTNQNQKVANKNPEETRSTPIADNRTVAPDLSQHLNSYVLDVVNSYNYKGENYPYLLNNDFENYNGVTEDIYYNGDLLLKAHPSGIKYSHCTGITFEVFFKAMQNRNKANGIDINDFNGMTKDELFDFMLIWYVAAGPKPQSNLAVAIEKYGLGQRITNLGEVAPGDFIDFSRENNTGHAVVFIDWIREGDKIIGLKHWSSQGSTKGISHKEEYFNIKDSNGKKYGNIILDSLYIGRISPINEYR